MKRSVLILLASLFVAVAGTAGFFLARPDPMAPRVKQLEEELARTQEAVSKLTVERDRLLAGSKRAVVAAPSSASIGASDSTTKAQAMGTKPEAGKPEDNSAAAAMSKLMSNSGARQMMRKQQEPQIDMIYGKLYQKLSLNDQERDNFKQLLGDRLQAQAEASVKLMNPSLTQAERNAVTSQAAVARQESDATIHKFLNNEADYKAYQNWEDTQQDRVPLEMGSSNFANAPLSDEQYDQLVATMARIRKAPSGVSDLNDPRNITPESLNPDGIAKQLKVADANNAQVLKEAASFLNPQQLEALNKTQEQMRVMMEASMKMYGQMFGAGKK